MTFFSLNDCSISFAGLSGAYREITCLMSSSSVLAISSSIIFFLSSRYRISGWDDCWLDVIGPGWVSIFPMINLYLTPDELSFDASHRNVLGS